MLRQGTWYFNGGAGYVLSRGAVARLVQKGLRQHQCRDHLQLGTKEDVNMALCLSYVGASSSFSYERGPWLDLEFISLTVLMDLK